MAFRMVEAPNGNPGMGSRSPKKTKLLPGIIRTGALTAHRGVTGDGTRSGLVARNETGEKQ
jgi:hypothetical protein